LVLDYYSLLRTVLRAKPRLRLCLTRCRFCRIFFLTHFRNAGRHNLRCPFGCRQAHRRQQSTQRSIAYYREPEGKLKKRALNQRRAIKAPTAHPEPAPPKVLLPRKISGKGSNHSLVRFAVDRWRRGGLRHANCAFNILVPCIKSSASIMTITAAISKGGSKAPNAFLTPS
jgi:hypothetical protein